MTSVKGLFCGPKPSIDSRMVGDEAREEVELGNRECPREEKVGVVGEGTSADEVEEVERWSPDPIGAESEGSIVVSALSFLRASTR